MVDSKRDRICDQGVFENGVRVFETIGYVVGCGFMDDWVREIAKISGQKVDFYKSGGGTWIVAALGDIDKVREAFKQSMSQYDLRFREQSAIKRRQETLDKRGTLDEERNKFVRQKGVVERDIRMIDEKISELDSQLAKLNQDYPVGSGD